MALAAHVAALKRGRRRERERERERARARERERESDVKRTKKSNTSAHEERRSAMPRRGQARGTR